MILVTGGTGFVGRRLVDALLRRQHHVRVLTRSAAGVRGVPAEVDLVTGDLLDAPRLSTVLEGVTAVVHLAAPVTTTHLKGSVPDYSAAFRINVEHTRHLARATRAASTPSFVHISSAGVYGDGSSETPHTEDAPPAPSSPYERSKLEAEVALREELDGSRVGWAVLRPAGIHGPGRPATLAFYREVLHKKMWFHGPAKVIVHPTYVDDVVNAILLVVERRHLAGDIFNVGGERPMLYRDLIDTVGRLLDVRVVQITAPPVAAAIARAFAGASRGLGRRPPASVVRLSAPVVNRSVDISKARRMLGFEPLPLESTISETAAWFRREGLL